MASGLSRRRVLIGAALVPWSVAGRAADDFPADPYKAPYPSPTGSMIPDKPYLRDSLGHVFTLGTQTPGDPLVAPTYYPMGPNSPGHPVQQASAYGGYVIYVNRVPVDYDPAAAAGQGPGSNWAVIYFTEMIVDYAGAVWAQGCNGQWYQYVGAGFHVQSSQPELKATEAKNMMPTDPPRATIAPGSSGRVVKVGPLQVIQTIDAALATAAAGDTLALDPVTFKEGFVVKVPIHFKGTPPKGGSPGTVISGAGVPLSAYPMHGRGGVVPTTDCIFDDIEFTGWGLLSQKSDLTSAIRPSGQLWLTCNRCRFEGNQCGIGTDGGGKPNNVVTLNDCNAEKNGLGDGYSHNHYFGNSTVRVVFKGSSSTSPKGGHALKSRAWGLTITGGTFDASDATPIDISDGTAAPFTIIDATINKHADDANHGVLGYAAESASNGSAGGTVSSVVNAACADPFVLVNAGVVSFSGSTFTGNRVTARGQASSVVGLP